MNAERLTEVKLIAGAVWVALAVVAFTFAVIVAMAGPDPTICPNCPIEWQQQVILREAP